ncbi:MAG: hypothetical protein ACI3Z9_06925 [Candidatus Onthomorpha sp.]
MLVSKNPYVVAEGLNLAPKNHYFALKTGENFTQNSRLKSLIFIIEKYGNKLLFNLLSKNTNRMQAKRFCLVGRNVFGVGLTCMSLCFTSELCAGCSFGAWCWSVFL